MRRAAPLAFGALLTLAACTGPPGIGPKPTPGFTVCLVPTIAGVRDGSLNQLTVQGIQAAGVTLRVMQPAAREEYLLRLQACTQTHPQLVAGVSEDMADAVASAASTSPSTHFLLVDAQPVDASGQPASFANVVSMVFDEKGAGYLAGALAGLMETQKVGAATHNATGILGSNHTPAVDAYIAGYVAGARAVDPQIVIKLAYSDSADPDFCRQLGRDQVTAGADILFEVTDRCAAGYIDAAYRSGVYAIGSQTDRAALSPAVISSAVKRVDRTVAMLVAEIKQGPFHFGVRRYGLADDGTGFSTPSSVVPQDIINRIEDIRAKIRTGAITPPDTIPPI